MLILCYFIQLVKMMNMEILAFGKLPKNMKKNPTSMDCIHIDYNSVYKIFIYTLEMTKKILVENNGHHFLKISISFTHFNVKK